MNKLNRDFFVEEIGVSFIEERNAKSVSPIANCLKINDRYYPLIDNEGHFEIMTDEQLKAIYVCTVEITKKDSSKTIETLKVKTFDGYQGAKEEIGNIVLEQYGSRDFYISEFKMNTECNMNKEVTLRTFKFFLRNDDVTEADYIEIKNLIFAPSFVEACTIVEAKIKNNSRFKYLSIAKSKSYEIVEL